MLHFSMVELFKLQSQAGTLFRERLQTGDVLLVLKRWHGHGDTLKAGLVERLNGRAGQQLGDIGLDLRTVQVPAQVAGVTCLPARITNTWPAVNTGKVAPPNSRAG